MSTDASSSPSSFSSFDAQTKADLTWGGQLESCEYLAKKNLTARGPAQGLPDLDPNGTGRSVYGVRDDKA